MYAMILEAMKASSTRLLIMTLDLLERCCAAAGGSVVTVHSEACLMKHCPAQPVLQLGWCWAQRVAGPAAAACSMACGCLLPWAGSDDLPGYLWPKCTLSTWCMSRDAEWAIWLC